MISEENNKFQNEFQQSYRNFWGLQVDKKFPDSFYEKTRKVICFETLGNLSFALEVLELFKKDVTTLEQEIIIWIREEMEKETSQLKMHESFGEIRIVFKDFIKSFEPNKEKLPPLKEAILKIYVNVAWSDKDILSINKATKEEWKNLLFLEISQDKRFEHVNSSYIVKKILERKGTSQADKKIRKIIIEIYRDKANEDNFYKEYMDYLIKRIDN